MIVKKEEKKKKITPVKKTAKSKIEIKPTKVKNGKVSSVKGYGVPKKEIIIAPADVCFWVNNGPALQSLLDLRSAFQTLTKEQYTYHANKQKNDFSAWVSAILKDEQCAKDLKKAKNMKDALAVVEKHLKNYSV
jgi:hypothetical protein